MLVIGLDHRGIRTNKLEESRNFYEDLIGLQRGHRPSSLVTKGYWLYAGSTPIIHLIEDTSNSVEIIHTSPVKLKDAGGKTHIALNVERARDAVNRLNDSNIPYWDRLFRDPAMYQVFVEDPNGLLIELIDRNPETFKGSVHKIVE